HGAISRRRDRAARLPGDPGDQPADRRDRRRQQPAGRPDVRVARSADPVLAMTDSAQTLPAAPARMRAGRAPAVARFTLGFARRKPLGAIGGAIVLALLIMAVFADRI